MSNRILAAALGLLLCLGAAPSAAAQQPPAASAPARAAPDLAHLLPAIATLPTGQGTGLGHSLTYDIVVKGCGGTLTVQSEGGVGTTFSLRLPC